MRRLLLRAGKSPFTAVSAETTLVQDVFNSNSGNALFQNAIWRALSTNDHEIVANATLPERRKPTEADIARINAEFDAFVVPLANAFRPDFERKLGLLSHVVERLDIPVIVVGVGAQAGTEDRPEALGPIREAVARFVSAVLDRSASIGVRGEFTADYLAGLGFGSEHVDVIGCPSLFLHGPEHRVNEPTSEITQDSQLAINLSPGTGASAGEFVSRQAERYPRLEYVMQDAQDLRLLLWGQPATDITDPRSPDHLEHFLYQRDRMRLFLDQWTWMEYFAQKDFVYGTRIHGNVAAILAGTPAYVLAHDSRTLELARYHAIPHRIADPVDPAWDAAELYAEADFTEFNRLMPERFATYTAFLDRNGLDHIWNHDGDDNGFLDRVIEQKFPGPVHTLCRPDHSEIASRLRWLRGAYRYDHKRHPDALTYDFDVPARRFPAVTEREKLDQRIVRQHERTVRQQDQITSLTKQIAALEKQIARTDAKADRTLSRRVYRWLRRLLRRS